MHNTLRTMKVKLLWCPGGGCEEFYIKRKSPQGECELFPCRLLKPSILLHNLPSMDRSDNLDNLPKSGDGCIRPVLVLDENLFSIFTDRDPAFALLTVFTNQRRWRHISQSCVQSLDLLDCLFLDIGHVGIFDQFEDGNMSPPIEGFV